jgi:hypothetical protein
VRVSVRLEAPRVVLCRLDFGADAAAYLLSPFSLHRRLEWGARG